MLGATKYTVNTGIGAGEKQVGFVRGTRWPAGSCVGRMVA
jgi:hypothetical protein